LSIFRTIEPPSNYNGRIHDHFEYGIEVAEIDYNARDSVVIECLINPQDASNIDQRIYPREILTNQDDSSSDLYNGAFSRNDEANGTPTSSINVTS